jgi:hypothetical protein
MGQRGELDAGAGDRYRAVPHDAVQEPLQRSREAAVPSQEPACTKPLQAVVVNQLPTAGEGSRLALH